MKYIARPLAWIAGVSLVSLALIIPGVPANAAATPTLTATETVANATAGTNNQSIATTSTTANVTEVKANRILNVVAAPAASESITIGSCVVSFATTTAGVGAQDTNCNDNAATIRTATTSNDIAKTAAQIATDLSTLANASSTGHGALTVAMGTTTTKVSFTTTNTEASSTAITFTDGTSGDIVSAGSTSGTVPVAQVMAANVLNVETGDVFNAIINGTTVSYTAAASTVADVSAGLIAAINASAVASAVTASATSTQINVTSDTAGTPFTLTVTTSNRAATAQVVTFTPDNIGTGDVVIATINGTDYSYTTKSTDDFKAIVEGLNAALSANSAATCTEDDTKVTCTAVSAGTGFTYSGSVTAAQSTSNSSRRSGGGGGGGHSSSSSNSNSSTSDLQAMIDKLKAQLAALIAKAGGTVPPAAVAGSFTMDLDVGSTGAEVKALQVYLNSHGFVVAATGAGSVGNETMTFGGATKAALMKFQAAKGISPASGYFGPKTRAFVNANP